MRLARRARWFREVRETLARTRRGRANGTAWMARTSPAMTAEVECEPSACVARTYSRALGARKALWLAAPPEEPPDEFDDNERYEPAEQYVGQIVAAEGNPEQA